ncbi:hypothetical protein EMN47_02615 [Prolixibacteraceae bacterium JC049]|nr:hypothetical protein [Prolixibacteraceae bacterium JC049]
MKLRRMLKRSVAWLMLCTMALPVAAQHKVSKEYSHDLSLPDWGPYTKNYIGVSHIPDKEKGIRFDLSVFPGFYRRKVIIPNVMYESGYHPWEASADLKYFSYRHELEWKDQVYTDISYSEIDDNARLIRMECVNNTNDAQSIVLHMMGSIHFPSIGPYRPDTPIHPATIKHSEESTFVDGLDYRSLDLVKKGPKYHLVTDGMMRGEVRQNGLINGSGVRFGKSEGDVAKYDFDVKSDWAKGTLWIRYQAKKDGKVAIVVDNKPLKEITFSGDKNLQTLSVELKPLNKGNHAVEFKAVAASEITIDGFVVTPDSDIAQIKVEQVKWKYAPKVAKGPVENTLILKYENVDQYYGLLWEAEHTKLREWHYRYLGEEFLRKINSHGGYRFGNSKDGHYTNVFIRPINMEPKSTKVLRGMVCVGSKSEVEARLKAYKGFQQAQSHYEKAKARLSNMNCIAAGERYLFSQERMFANTIQNVVYPVYTQKQYIKHHAPGRWWDCLYTWDSGFIGIGLAQVDEKRGEENLHAYLNNEDEQSAFIHHGTPLPVQHYLYQELWNQYQSEEMLATNYPKLKNYYEFLSGRDGRSSTRTKQNLIKTWDYFYNSGGWDDYPPQGYVNWKKLRGKAAPVVSTAHVIRIAKILRMTAIHLKKKADVKAYDKDIAELSKALNTHSWDEESGYYGYVVTEDDGTTKVMRYGNKANYNMGLGGASPLIAGICDDNQQQKLISHLRTPGEIWSNVGLSAVDQTAPYYNKSGYWNGTVWMPHQWFFWKSMFDYGETEFAHQIAKKALEVWKKETEGTYNCFEHFVIESGKGAGWHQFSGLSSCVTSWFKSYFMPGTLTGGYDTFISEKVFNAENSSMKAKLRIHNKNKAGFVVVLNDAYNYQVFWNGKPIESKELYKGCLTVQLNAKQRKGVLEVRKANN